jgi:hypothetical protein
MVIAKEDGPYVLVTDNDSHWYVIPAARQDHWDANAQNDFTGEEGPGEIPDYAEPVGGAPSLVEFDSYVLN